MKKRIAAASTTTLMIVILLSSLFQLQPVIAQTPPPVTGDWIIADTTVMNDTTILLDGNLTIETSGHLTLRNVTLIMNCSDNRTFGIEVQGSPFGAKGEFIVTNTTIRSANESYYYNFSVNGRMTMRACTVRNLMGALNLADPLNSLGGIQIGSSNVLIEDTNITDYQSIGISVNPFASPTVRRCNISISGLAFTIGILEISTGISSPVYQDNFISGNLLSGIVSFGLPIMTMFGEIRGNTFQGNTVGVTCFGTSPDIIDNDFNTNLVGSIALMSCDSEISGNAITVTGSGISVLDPSDPHIHNNTINLSAIGILLSNGTACHVHHNNISGNLVYGISATGANSEIYHNDMYNNLLVAISLDDSASKVHHNTIVSATIGTGIQVLNDSAPNIYLNDIVGGDFSTGISLTGNRSMQPVMDRNTFDMGADCTCIDIEGFSPLITDNTLNYDQGANGLNATGSTPTITGNTFTGLSATHGVYIQDSTPKVENNSLSGNEMGVYVHNCTPEVKYNDISNNGGLGILVERSRRPAVAKNVFNEVNGNPAGSHAKIEAEVVNSTHTHIHSDNSYIRLLNSTWDYPLIGENTDFRVQFDWFLDVFVKMPDDSPAQGVDIALINSTGVEKYNFVTDSEGKSIWNRVTEWVFFNGGSDLHSPYDVQVEYSPWVANKTVILDHSQEVHLKLGFDNGPSDPFNILPKSTHNRTPMITWNASVDPDDDPIHYILSMGTNQGGKQVLADINTSGTAYQVSSPLNFRRYYISLSAHTPDGNSSAKVSSVLDIVNNPPELQHIDDMVFYLEDKTSLKFFMNATDPDTDPKDALTYGANTTLFTADPLTGEVNWTPTENDLGTHIVNFTISDGFAIDFELVSITVTYRNEAPVANAGEDFTAYVDIKITLNGSGSYDPDGTIVDYEWKPDKIVLLNITDKVRPHFKTSELGNYSFQLRVRDDMGVWSATDNVVVTVLPGEPDIPIPEPILTLKFGKVTPIEGDLNDTFVFSVTLFAVNATGELLEMMNESDFLRVKIDERRNFDMTRQDGAIDLEAGVHYSREIAGDHLFKGNHTFRFFSDYQNLTGDVGVFQGPRVIESVGPDDDVIDDNDDDDDVDTGALGICAVIFFTLLLLIAIIVAIGIFIIRRRAFGFEQEEFEDDGEEDDEEDEEEERGKRKKKSKRKKEDDEDLFDDIEDDDEDFEDLFDKDWQDEGFPDDEFDGEGDLEDKDWEDDFPGDEDDIDDFPEDEDDIDDIPDDLDDEPEFMD
jgi:parallel beta-helix repeat protein